MKNILIVNDDGIGSPGLVAAKNAVEGLGNIAVVTPATPQSGVGRAITLFHPVRISEMNLLDGTKGYVVTGTPTDCIILGILAVFKTKPDLVVSGINIGENLSMELTTSGTTAAAMEAANGGIPAIAVSLQIKRTKRTESAAELDFSIAQKVTEKIAKWVLENGLPAEVDLLNVNIPHNATDKTPIVVTKLARRMYQAFLTQGTDDRGGTYFTINGEILEKDAEAGTDVHAVFIENFISITPISLDMTAHSVIKNMEKLKLDLERF
ncbi:MAG: 5'/3'-nucleotidase SurE [Euryarchaeota archaeon]|nr:5'/3'-nucleotidase SurE [Euryarchaeota archaeon]